MNREKLTSLVGGPRRCSFYDVLTVLKVSGIGHKIKSVNNPDLRVELVKEYVRKNFPSHSLLDYALAVEKVTTSKKDTLILNVDELLAAIGRVRDVQLHLGGLNGGLDAAAGRRRGLVKTE